MDNRLFEKGGSGSLRSPKNSVRPVGAEQASYLTGVRLTAHKIPLAGPMARRNPPIQPAPAHAIGKIGACRRVCVELPEGSPYSTRMGQGRGKASNEPDRLCDSFEGDCAVSWIIATVRVATPPDHPSWKPHQRGPPRMTPSNLRPSAFWLRAPSLAARASGSRRLFRPILNPNRSAGWEQRSAGGRTNRAAPRRQAGDF